MQLNQIINIVIGNSLFCKRLSSFNWQTYCMQFFNVNFLLKKVFIIRVSMRLWLLLFCDLRNKNAWLNECEWMSERMKWNVQILKHWNNSILITIKNVKIQWGNGEARYWKQQWLVIRDSQRQFLATYELDGCCDHCDYDNNIILANSHLNKLCYWIIVLLLNDALKYL